MTYILPFGHCGVADCLQHLSFSHLFFFYAISYGLGCHCCNLLLCLKSAIQGSKFSQFSRNLTHFCTYMDWLYTSRSIIQLVYNQPVGLFSINQCCRLWPATLIIVFWRRWRLPVVNTTVRGIPQSTLNVWILFSFNPLVEWKKWIM